MPFTRAASKARRSLAAAAASGAGFFLKNRCTVATDSSPAAASPSSTSLSWTSVALIPGLSALIACIPHASSASMRLLVPRSERLLGARPSKPDSR